MFCSYCCCCCSAVVRVILYLSNSASSCCRPSRCSLFPSAVHLKASLVLAGIDSLLHAVRFVADVVLVIVHALIAVLSLMLVFFAVDCIPPDALLLCFDAAVLGVMF